jgi:hypothetical protein
MRLILNRAAGASTMDWIGFASSCAKGRDHGGAGNLQLLQPKEASQPDPNRSGMFFRLDSQCLPYGDTIIFEGMIGGIVSGLRATPANCRKVGGTASTPYGQNGKRDLTTMVLNKGACIGCQFDFHDLLLLRHRIDGLADWRSQAGVAVHRKQAAPGGAPKFKTACRQNQAGCCHDAMVARNSGRRRPEGHTGFGNSISKGWRWP